MRRKGRFIILGERKKKAVGGLGAVFAEVFKKTSLEKKDDEESKGGWVETEFPVRKKGGVTTPHTRRTRRMS